MKNSNKSAHLKEKLKQALNSTFKVISDDFKIDKNISSKKDEFFDLQNLDTKKDFIEARAKTDSLALKKKFSDEKIFKKNLPSNPSCKSLYTFAEKIRYESLGFEILKGIKKNLEDDYNEKINLKRKDQIKSKEDVPVNEAFELYMLKNFHNIELNSITSKMLSFWEKDFDNSILKHKEFLKSNLENQNDYSSKFSEILQEMDIFQDDNNDESKEENQDDGQENPSNNDQNSENEDNKDSKDNESEESISEANYNVDDYKLDEQLTDSENDNDKNEQVIQKKKS